MLAGCGSLGEVIMAVPHLSLLTCALLLIQLSSSSGGKILVFPLDGSHWLEIRLQDKPSSFWSHAWSRIQMQRVVVNQFYQFHKRMSEMIVQMFEDENLMRSLHDAKYDVVLTDPGIGGGAMLAHRLQVPLVFNVRWTIQAYMGGFQCKPPKPLPADLEEFVQSSGDHGVIVMTLGTLVGKLPQDIAEEIAAAFAQLPQKVIWSLITSPESEPKEEQ
ncbi:UDP-glucuronosyltransferase 2C1-like protein [Lates japonicus]|uniref:UDP-glucuronosyltransferase 2C1-like protein n=1 Tax=Lates japonicus TaxID=270547 RepID=A0AAD3NI30_LATJO|nr:UDP-glucuronosyltransferase 2C1-like protein [Lates japonicus]